MIMLKILSAVLSYPTIELQAALPELGDLINDDRTLPRARRKALRALTDELQTDDIYTLQERYVALFDRGRALSLHLFEHVHGESRDRGQAMVDLIDVYRRNGFELSARELPDYVPLFLEFLSQIPAREANSLLADASPVLTLLGARLTQRQSRYAAIFDALEAIGGAAADAKSIRRRVAEEGADQTVVQMDRIWEEEAVTFLGSPGGSCGTNAATELPVQWVGRSPRS